MIQAIITYIIVFSAFAYAIYKLVRLFLPRKHSGMPCGEQCACAKGEIMKKMHKGSPDKSHRYQTRQLSYSRLYINN